MTTTKTYGKISVIRGTCPHGKVLFAALNDPKILRSYAKNIAAMLAAGFTIDRSETPVQLGGNCSQCNEATR